MEYAVDDNNGTLWRPRTTGPAWIQIDLGKKQSIKRRDRVKERKARTRRLIQEGAILEKVLPEVRTMELPALEGYLSRKLGKEI